MQLQSKFFCYHFFVYHLQVAGFENLLYFLFLLQTNVLWITFYNSLFIIGGTLRILINDCFPLIIHNRLKKAHAETTVHYTTLHLT